MKLRCLIVATAAPSLGRKGSLYYTSILAKEVFMFVVNVSAAQVFVASLSVFAVSLVSTSRGAATARSCGRKPAEGLTNTFRSREAAIAAEYLLARLSLAFAVTEIVRVKANSSM